MSLLSNHAGISTAKLNDIKETTKVIDASIPAPTR